MKQLRTGTFSLALVVGVAAFATHTPVKARTDHVVYSRHPSFGAYAQQAARLPPHMILSHPSLCCHALARVTPTWGAPGACTATTHTACTRTTQSHSAARNIVFSSPKLSASYRMSSRPPRLGRRSRASHRKMCPRLRKNHFLVVHIFSPKADQNSLGGSF